MKKCYLSGLINTAVLQTLEWRLKARRDLKEKFEVIDPLRGKEKIYYGHDAVADQTNGMRSGVMSNRQLLLRDYRDVHSVDVLLVNLDDYAGGRPLVGTLFELAWAWESRIPIVGFAPEDCWIREHCFIQEVVGEMFSSLDEAIRYLVEVF